MGALEREDVNCFKGFALPVEAKAKPLKTLKLAFQSFAKPKAEMASFEMGVVGSSPTWGAKFIGFVCP